MVWINQNLWLMQKKKNYVASKNKNAKKSFCIKCLLPSISANFLHLFYSLKFWQKIENWKKYLKCNYFNFRTHVTNYSSEIWFCFVSLCNTRRPENRFFLLAMHETKDGSTFLIKGEGKWRPSKLDLVLFGLRSDRFIMQQKNVYIK